MSSMFAKDRDYVRMKFMSFKDRDIGQDIPKIGRFGEKVSKEDYIGTPLKLLHEGEGHRVTVELKNGDLCRGTLIESEDNWSSQLEDMTYISRKKRAQKHGCRRKPFKLDLVFIRGRRIRFIVLPDMLKRPHLFKLPNAKTKEPGRFIVLPDMLKRPHLFKLPNAKTKEEKDDDLRLTLRLLHLTNYSQKIAAEQGRFYI